MKIDIILIAIGLIAFWATVIWSIYRLVHV